MTVEKKRIFIGGLFSSINETDLRERFSHFGTVSNIEIKTKNGDNDTPKKTFAYLDITASEQNVKKCLTLFNKTKWKGHKLKLEEAKESFLTRLEAERQEIKKQASQGSQTSSPNYSDNHVIRPLDNIPGVKDYAMKGAKSGTPIPGEKKQMGSQKVSLFDHSSDAESDEDEEAAKRDQDMFRLRPEFEGETGKKLMKLQSRYGNDPRFRLDKRFKESDSENEMLMEYDEEDETTKSLKILRDVLGDKANIKVTLEERKKNIFKDVTVLHFDPTREDHKHYEIKKLEGIQKETQSKKKKKKMKQDSQHQDEWEEKKNLEPPVGKDKFYQVSSSLMEAFSNKGSSTQSDNKGFSLLAMFGSKKDDDKQTQQDHSDVLDQEKTDKAFKIKTPYLWEHFGGDDDGVRDNSDDEKSNKAIQEESNKQDIIPITSAGSKTFFITKDDERLKEGTTFCRRESLEIIRKKWEEQRPLLVEMYKTRYKQQRRKSRNGMKPKRF